jgi:hypothetical protein
MMHALDDLVPRFNDTSLDFVTLVGVPPADFGVPEGWQSYNFQCIDEVATLFINHRRWNVSKDPPEQGCMQVEPQPDRPYIVQHVSNKKRPQLSVVVAAAHFSEPKSMDATLGAAIRKLRKAAKVQNVMVVANTNLMAPQREECPHDMHCMSNGAIMDALLNVSDSNVVGTDLLGTCCGDSLGFRFAFDRIIANFGTNMVTHLDDQLEGSGEDMHKRITGELYLPYEPPAEADDQMVV